MRKTLMRNIRLSLLFVAALFLPNCAGRKVYGEENPDLFIRRFDVDFYNYLQQNGTDSLFVKYPLFLELYGEKILSVGKPEDPGFREKLKEYFSNPALMDLYRAEQKTFGDISAINSELSRGLDMLLKSFPDIRLPQVYMHVSGWEQKVVVTDEILSLSADFYLGKDYPPYQGYFYEYQRELMVPDRMVPDYLKGFLMANFPFEGKEDVLLDRILYEGKLAYVLSCLLPDRQIWEYIGYTKEEYLWCSNSQARIWKTILEKEHLFTPNYLTTSRYLKEAPHTAFLPEESPGRVGVWLGNQIINAYVSHNKDITLPELMKNTDYLEILKQSQYKP